MSIAAGSLPPPHEVLVDDDSVVRVTGEGQLPFWSRPDAALDPRVFRLQWRDLSGAAADAIRRHYAEHRAGSFQITIPRTGEVVRVTWRTPPSISWSSWQFASSVTAELDEALAYD